jgi:hypothetical protein
MRTRHANDHTHPMRVVVYGTDGVAVARRGVVPTAGIIMH